MRFNRAAILGLGLIGGSFARALKERSICGHVVGFGRNADNLKQAQSLGHIDFFALDPAAACRDADLVLLSSPIESFGPIIRQAAPALRKGTLVLDAGSVKASVISELEPLIPEGVEFVPCHPIAGGERSGAAASDPKLFDEALCIITPSKRTAPEQIARATALWEALGARVQTMDAAEHDRIYALVSHMPHLAAYALVQSVAGANPDALKYAGRGFMDATRIALSSPEMWAGICKANRANVLADTRLLIDAMTEFSRKLERDDDALSEAFAKARDFRRRL